METWMAGAQWKTNHHLTGGREVMDERNERQVDLPATPPGAGSFKGRTILNGST